MSAEETKSKPLLYILILLILLLVSVGLINYYYVKKIDDSYTKLIGSLMKEDKAIHEVTRNSTKSILILSKILKANTIEKNRLIKQLDLSIIKNNVNFDVLDSICSDDFKKKNLNQLRAFRKEYLDSKDSLLKLIDMYGSTENVKAYYRNVVKTKLDIYQDQQMLFAYNAKYAILENSDAITSMSSNIRNITFGLLFAPIILIGVGILYVFTILYQTSTYEDDI